MERNRQEYEDSSRYAGNLAEETSYLLQETRKEEEERYAITVNTGFLTIFCC